MKYALVCALLLLISACAQQAAEESDQDFVNDIVRTLGTDGEACKVEAGQTYCVSASRSSPKPVTAGDHLEAGQELWLCLRQFDGNLANCEPIAQDSIHCLGEPGAGGGCRCTGVDACLKMAGDKSCKNGSCGDCAGAQCCCEY